MPSFLASFFASALALTALAGQSLPDDSLARLRLESQRRELITMLQDKNWMRDQGRATIARLEVEKHWKACAGNEALALAKASERPARLLAEAALAACQPWQSALELALARGAYPYIEGREANGRVSREDMVALARLASQDAALARILMWRGAGRAAASDASSVTPRADLRARIDPKPAPIPARLAPPEPEQAPVVPAAGEEMEIVVTGRSGACRVRLADRTLTESELAAKARAWAEAGTALKVIRPRGADYHCMAKIAWQLGKQNMRLFEFVDRADPEPAAKPR